MMLEAATVRIAAALPRVGVGNGVSVLCYHAIVGSSTERGRFTVAAAMLQKHLKVIRDSGRPLVSLASLRGTSPPSVLMTFDDNLPSHVSHALPILKDAQAPAVFYVNPGQLRDGGGMTHGDVEALLKAGMAIGAHGARHVLVKTLDASQFARDVQTCATFLRSIGMPLTWAYPGGHIGSFRRTHDRILQDHGFQLRFSTLEGVCHPSDHHRVQSRYVIRRDSSELYVRAAVAGGLQLLRFAKRIDAVAAALRAVNS